MIIIDASAMVELLRPTDLAESVRRLVAGQDSHAPHLLDVEVVQVLRRFLRKGMMTHEAVDEAIVNLRAFPLTRHSHVALLHRAMALADNVTAYDGMYLALAEALGAVLVTCDGKMVGVPGCHAEVALAS